MNRDPKSIRRRALLATLAPVLDEPTLLRELWYLPDALRGEAVGDIIELIDALAARHGVPAASCKRLYTELFRTLRLADDALPPDPWPAMQALRPQDTPAVAAGGMAGAGRGMGEGTAIGRPAPAGDYAAASPFALPVYAAAPAVRPAVLSAMTLAAQAAPSAAVAPPAPAPAFGSGFAAPFTAAPVAPVAAVAAMAPTPPAAVLAVPDVLTAAASRVHGAVMRAAVAEVQRHHREALDEIRNDVLRLLAASPMPASLREPCALAWGRPSSHDWVLPGQPAELAALMRLMHRALELSFGRVGADHILQRAATAAEALPEAAQFPPARLLPGAA